jgi:hypothetical protein
MGIDPIMVTPGCCIAHDSHNSCDIAREESEGHRWYLTTGGGISEVR